MAPEIADLADSLSTRDVEARVALESSQAHESLSRAFRRAVAGVTPTLVAVASSGTVAVGPSGRNGGLLAALPPQHVAIVHERDIRDSLAEALPVVVERSAGSEGEAVLITGPSRTADIEMMSVLGVHGPLRLDIVVVLED